MSKKETSALVCISGYALENFLRNILKFLNFFNIIYLFNNSNKKCFYNF